jgi:magnesium transporter
MMHIQHRNTTWIDFEDINSQDLEYLHENFNIHPVALEELLVPSYQPKVVQYDNCLFFSVHVPLFDTKERTTYPGELDIILTSEHLITSHRHSIYQISHLFRQIESSESKRREYLAATPAHLLHHILDVLFKSCFPKLNHITDKLEFIEKEVFRGHEKTMVYEISVLKRDILNFRRTLKPQRAILESLIQKEHPFIPRETKVYLQDLVGTNIRLWNILESQKETIEALEGTNNSLLSSKLNVTMKVLTLFSAVALPASVYANAIAMSASIPFGTHPHAFWIHASIMITMCFVTIVIFRIKQWI